MIRTLIIEDEQAAYENLMRFLQIIDSNIQIIHWLKSVETSVQWLRTHPVPDLIFLDIQLSDGNSFSIFKQVSIQCPIIFTTAYNQFALNAFELHSIDYLLKPISKEKLSRAIQKFHQMRPKAANVDTSPPQLAQLQALMMQMQSPKSYKNRFLVKKGDQLISIPTSKIAYFYVDEFTILVTKEGKKFSLSYSLDKLMELVDPAQFFRLNRKVITNYDSIKSITRYSTSKLNVVLIPSTSFEIMISKEKAQQFKQWLE